MGEDKSFLGTGWGYPPTFEKQGLNAVQMVSNEEDIRQSLEILLATAVGERIMLPKYGCNLKPYLFKSINNSQSHFIQNIIHSAIVRYETRVQLIDVQVDGSNYREGVISVNIEYSVRKTNTRFNLVYPYYITEGTNLPLIQRKQVASNASSDTNLIDNA